MKQKDAVFNEISTLRGTTEFSEAVQLSKSERAEISTNLISGFKNGTIEYNGDVADESKLNSYVSGLISNWLRKDKRLNGNTTYVPQNKGSRAGRGDDAVKAMRALLSVTEDEEARAEIQREIDKRVAELKPKKSINVDALPDSLKHLASEV